MIRDQVGDSAYNGYLEIEVKNPRTHIEKEKALYTDYEIELKTNNPTFPLLHSRIRRRYSEFVWLKNKLGLEDVVFNDAPKLPKKRVIGRFKENFLWRRQEGLQKFLNRLANITVFVNHPAFLIFVQTTLTAKQMDYYLKTRTPGGIRSLILRLHDKKLKEEEKQHRPRTKSISAEYPPTEKSQSRKSTSYGKGWSSYHGDCLFTFDEDFADVDDSERGDFKKVRSISCVAYPTGLLTLPTIPGSSEDGLDSMDGSMSNTDPEEVKEHPLSHSWHGTTRDEIDLVLEEYEIIPLDSISQVAIGDEEDSETFSDMDADYVDVFNPDLRCGSDHRFDY